MANSLLDPPDNPLISNTPSLADAWSYNYKLASDWLQQQRQQAYDLGYADPATGLPTQKGLMAAVQQYTNSLLLGTTSPGLRAFHGSPYDFDRFDMSKVGSGEGFQAYGHGLYFAESPQVAKAYRETLSEGPTGDVAFAGDKVVPDDLQQTAIRIAKTPDAAGSPQAYIDYAQRQMAANEQRIAAGPEGYSTTGYRPGVWHSDWGEYVDGLRQTNQYYQDEIGNAKQLLGQKIESRYFKPPGTSYEVSINTGRDKLLDYDKELMDQPPAIQDAVHDVGKQFKVKIEPEMTGADLHDLLSNPDAVSALRQRGVNGVQYLDQMSRDDGEGTRNFVIFDDNLVNIVRKYGIAGLAIGAGSLAAQPGTQAQP